MKFALLEACFIILIFSGRLLYGQAKVTGHIFAEIVESISVSCQNKAEMTYYKSTPEKLNCCNLVVSGSASSPYTLILENSDVSNFKGDVIPVQTSVITGGKNLMVDLAGKQSLTVSAGTKELSRNDRYQGNVTVTVAYY